jgi:RNA polymerase sigma-B factor
VPRLAQESGPGLNPPVTRTSRNHELAAALRRARCPRELARLANELAEENIQIADSIASRYVSRGIAREDLQQVARLALVRASRAFSPDREQDFLAYAVPCIRGELRRHFRDAGWMVRPPRRVQEAQYRIQAARAALTERLGREPGVDDFADSLELDAKTVTEALTLDGCFHPESLDRAVSADGAGHAVIGDRLAADAGEFERSEARLILAPLLAELSPRDARVLHLRFFEGLTQREVGEAIGVTQMQVSRILGRVLGQLREHLEGSLKDDSRRLVAA